MIEKEEDQDLVNTVSETTGIYSKDYKLSNRPEEGTRSIVRDWVGRLTSWQQSVLLSAVRASDVDGSQTATRMVMCLRWAILHPTTSDSFNDEFLMDGNPPEQDQRAFLRGCKRWSLFWLSNFLQAAAIVGYKCPDIEVREAWIAFYGDAARDLGFNPVAEDDIDNQEP